MEVIITIRDRLLIDLFTAWAALAAICAGDPAWPRFASEVRTKLRAVMEGESSS